MSNGQLVSQVTVGHDKPLDREKVCPMLLRVFVANNRHNPMSEYNSRNGGSVPPSELQMHTWYAVEIEKLVLFGRNYRTFV